MIYSKKNYSAFFTVPNISFGKIELSWTRADKNISSFDFTKSIAIKRKESKSKPTKKRFEKIILKFPEKTILTHVGVSADGSTFDLIGKEHQLIPKITYVKPLTIEYLAYYEKSRKLKILYRSLILNTFPVGNIHWVMSQWTHIFAIDTNTRVIENGLTISITSVIKGTIVGAQKGQGMYKFETYYIEPYVNIQCNPELFAICKLISKITKDFVLPQRVSVGIITDCELGLIDEFNSKKRDLLPDYFPGLYLPESFHLMYASAEAGRDTFIPNKMMALCESSASEAFKGLVINRPESK